MTSKKHNFVFFAKIKSMDSMFKNLSWVVVCSIIAKLIGGLYRIVLTRILGTNIGLYQLVFSAYSFLVILISSGIPLAISKLISTKTSKKSQQKIICGAVSILLLLSGILAFGLVVGSKGLALLQGEGRVFICYIILAPSLIFSAGSAVLKGYFQGINRFKTSSIANILEQVIRVFVGIFAMLMLQKFYVLGSLLGAMIGTLAGDVFAFVYLKIKSSNTIKLKYSKTHVTEGKKVLKYAFPIMLYSLMLPFANFVDSFLVVKLLGVNLPKSTSILLYGLQSGAVNSIISIPAIFSFALASVLMPNISGSRDGDSTRFNQKVIFSYKLMLFVVVPSAVYFAINSSSIINLIYGTSINGCGVNGNFVAKNLLTISSIGIAFSTFNQLSGRVCFNISFRRYLA